MDDEVERKVRRALDSVASRVTGGPPQPSDSYLAGAQGSWRRQARLSRWVPIAGAAVLIAGLAATITVFRGNSGEILSGGLTGASSNPATADSSGTGSELPSSSPPTTQPVLQRPPDCQAPHLSPSVDNNRTGPADGIENVVITLRNTDTAPCWLDVIPALRAQTPSGGTDDLPFQGTKDASVIGQPQPGEIDPAGLGMFRLQLNMGVAGSEMGDNTCNAIGSGAERHIVRSRTVYDRLLITLGDQPAISMQYPAVLYDGCPIAVSQAGVDAEN